MYYSYQQEVLQEVPGEISLALSISGCTLNCKGCHSTETFKKDFGVELTKDELLRLLKKHKYISCVLFYGGEWEIDNLYHFLIIIKELNLKTALYSGNDLTYFHESFLKHLDYIKVGAYKKELGGLSSNSTNQKFFVLEDGKIKKDITETFQL